MSKVSITQSDRILERLARTGSQGPSDISVVTSPGARASTFPAIIKSHYSYNYYNVCMVELRYPGSEPDEVGAQIQAVNLAESFSQTGSLANGTYVLMSKIGKKNVFYAKV